MRKRVEMRAKMEWCDVAPEGIALVLTGEDADGEWYEEGGVSGRLLTGATMLGYGAGVAWFGEPHHEAEAKRILGIPESRQARQMVLIGRRKSTRDPRPTGPPRGRRPLSELVSFERFGAPKR